MILTITVLENEEGFEPARPWQVSVNLFCSVIMPEGSVPVRPLPKAAPFFVTEHEMAFELDHVMVVVSPCRTSEGAAVIAPLGGGGGMHAPAEQVQPVP